MYIGSAMDRLAIINGAIWTGDGTRVLGSVIIESGRITSLIPGPPPASLDCPVLDAKRGSVLPAFTDPHAHCSQLARFKTAVDLFETKSKEEAIDLLFKKSQGTDPNQWIVGTKAQEGSWTVPSVPTREELDRIPNPTVVLRICLHSLFANSRAIELIGVEKFAGLEGAIRDANGAFTGTFEEAARVPFFEQVKSDAPDAVFRSLCHEWLSYGLAEIHPIADEDFEYYQKLSLSQPLPVKFRLYPHNPSLNFSMISGQGNSKLCYGGLKIFLDGSIGARTAAVRAPYADVGSNGVLLYSDEDLYSTVTQTFEHNVQLMVHCIGDAALDQFLNVLEKVQANGIVSRWPVKLTHLEICHQDQIERMTKLNCVCDVQPHMIISDSPFLETILGSETSQICFPIRSMIEAGLVVTGSSDAPVEPIDPLTGIWAATVRTPQVNPEEVIDLDAALKLYTINPQKVIMNDGEKGLIKSGYVADIVVFQEDLFEVPLNDLRSCHVAWTLVDGEVVYSRAKARRL
jgi:predicted amidohydrolase YtcJ